MSSEEPDRSVPDELFQQVTAKPGRQLPDALFGPPPARTPRAEREEPIRSVPDELFKQVTARTARSLPDALFGPMPAPAVAEPEQAEQARAAESASGASDSATAIESAETDGAVAADSAVQEPDTAPDPGTVNSAASVDGTGADAATVAAQSDIRSAIDSETTGADIDSAAAASEDVATELVAADLPELATSTGAVASAAGSVEADQAESAGVGSAASEGAATVDAADVVPTAVEREAAAAGGSGGPGVTGSEPAVVDVSSGIEQQVDAGENVLAGAPATVIAAAGEAESASVDGVADEIASETGESVAAQPAALENSVATSSAETTVVAKTVVAQGEPAAAVPDGVLAESEAAELPVAQASPRPVLLVVADSLAYYGPKGGLPADDPRIWPNLVAAELDWDVELIARIGWTCRDAYWALIGDPRVWAAVPRAGAVVFAVGGMDTLPSPLPTALRELIRYIRPPRLRRGVRSTYNWLQPKLSKLGRPVALPPKVSVDYLEQSREALAQLRPDLPVVAVLPSVHKCDAYGRVHRGRAKAVKALQAWSGRTSVPLVDLGEAVREDIESGSANPDGIHWGWAGHTAVATAMTKALQEVR